MEWIFSGVSLFLSMIAIIVSIYTVSIQNKLSLFDKRYDVVHTLNFLIILNNLKKRF